MKKLFSLMLCLFVSMATFTSCNCNDDEGDATDGIQETANQLTLIVSGNHITQTHTATFGNGACTRYTIANYYVHTGDADEAWTRVQQNGVDLSKYTRSGDVITVDYTSDYTGRSKTEMRELFEFIKAHGMQEIINVNVN